MIIKSSSRGGAMRLAHHLVRTDQNETVEVSDARDLAVCLDGDGSVHSALRMMDAYATGTNAQARSLYHISMNPDREIGTQAWQRIWDTYEQEYNLGQQPFIEVTHIKKDRVHKHRVYPTVTEKGRRINTWHNYQRNEKVARILEHDLEHPLTQGRHNRTVMQTLEREGRGDVVQWMEQQLAHEVPRPVAEKSHKDVQQAERTKVPVEEVKADLREVYERADNGCEFIRQIEAKGYHFCRGERRDYVVVDRAGGVHSPARRLGVKVKELREKWSDIDRESLPVVSEVQAAIKGQVVSVKPFEQTEKSSVEQDSREPFFDTGAMTLDELEAVREKLAASIAKTEAEIRALESAQDFPQDVSAVIHATPKEFMDSPNAWNLTAANQNEPVEEEEVDGVAGDAVRWQSIHRDLHDEEIDLEEIISGIDFREREKSRTTLAMDVGYVMPPPLTREQVTAKVMDAGQVEKKPVTKADVTRDVMDVGDPSTFEQKQQQAQARDFDQRQTINRQRDRTSQFDAARNSKQQDYRNLTDASMQMTQEQSNLRRYRQSELGQSSQDVLLKASGRLAKEEREHRLSELRRLGHAQSRVLAKDELTQAGAVYGRALREKGNKQAVRQQGDRWFAKRLAERGYSRHTIEQRLIRLSPELMYQSPGERLGYVREVSRRAYQKEQEKRRQQEQEKSKVDKSQANRTTQGIQGHSQYSRQQEREANKRQYEAYEKATQSLNSSDYKGYKGQAEREFNKDIGRKLRAGNDPQDWKNDQDTALKMSMAGYSRDEVARAVYKGSIFGAGLKTDQERKNYAISMAAGVQRQARDERYREAHHIVQAQKLNAAHNERRLDKLSLDHDTLIGRQREHDQKRREEQERQRLEQEQWKRYREEQERSR